MSDLPPGWSHATIGDLLLRIEAGKSFRCEPRPASPSEWGIIKVSAMTWGAFLEGENKAVPAGVDFNPNYEIKAGDILVSRANTEEYVGAPVLVNRCRSRLLLSDKSLRLVPSGHLNSRWFYYLLSSSAVRREISRRATGTKDSMRNVSQETLASIRVQVPPLAEQDRIVTALEHHLSRASLGDQNLKQVRLRSLALRRSLLDAAVAGRLVPRGSSDAKEWLSKVVNTRLEFSKKYKPAVLPVGVPGYQLPDRWAITSLDAISFASGYGTSTRCDFGAAGGPVLRIPNIQHGEIVLDNLKSAVDSSIDLSSLYVDQRDILFIRTNGSRDLIGRAGVVRRSLQIAYASYLIRFRLIPNGIPSDWVLLVVSSPLWRAYLEYQASSSAGQYNLNSRILAQLPIPVPPPDEISLILSQVGRYADMQRAFDSECADGEKRSRQLHRSLLAEAFAGRLVPQDPGDEPGWMLLERIRAERAAQPQTRRGRGTPNHVPQEGTLL